MIALCLVMKIAKLLGVRQHRHGEGSQHQSKND